MQLNDARAHLTTLFSHLNLPPTGVSRAWLKTVEEVQSFTTTLMEEHGPAGAKLIEEMTAALKPTGKGAWAIRSVLADLSRTVAGIEHDLRDIGGEEHDTMPRACDRNIGIWSWREGEEYSYWDEESFQILGVPRSIQPNFQLLVSMIVTDAEKHNFIMKAERTRLGQIKGHQSTITIKRMDNGEIRRIYIRAERHEAKGGVFLSGYFRDITHPCVVLTPDVLQPFRVMNDFDLTSAPCKPSSGRIQ